MKNNFVVFLLLLTCFVTGTSTADALLQPVQLRCEYLDNPLGIDILKPRLSWNFTSSLRNQSQTGYEIIVSDNRNEIKNHIGKVWQTGKIMSGQNIQIDYAGAALLSFTKYYWCVKVYDQDGLASAWSAVATFETAMLQQQDWTAKWIDDGSRQFDRDEDFYRHDPMPLFKKQVILQKKIAAARLYVSGLGYSEVYLNEKKNRGSCTGSRLYFLPQRGIICYV